MPYTNEQDRSLMTLHNAKAGVHSAAVPGVNQPEKHLPGMPHTSQGFQLESDIALRLNECALQGFRPAFLISGSGTAVPLQSTLSSPESPWMRLGLRHS